MKKTFTVYGMSCQACALNVERAVKKIEGIHSATVSLLTNSLEIDAENVSDELICDAIKTAGYTAVSGRKQVLPEHVHMKKRLIASVCLLLPLLYLSLGKLIGLPVPFPSSVQIILEFFLCSGIVILNRKYFIQGIPALFRGHPNMDSLVALGSSVAFVYSTISAILLLFFGSSLPLYFESAGMILTLITIGKYLESRSKGKTTEAITRLINLTPKSATILRNGKEVTVSLSEVQIGDLVIVRSGERIPVDGKVVDGTSSVDTSSLTGESIPVLKKVEDNVQAGTVCQYGCITVTAEKIGEETTLKQIIKLVQETASSKAPIARMADKVSGIFVPVVILIAVIVFVIWTIAGAELSVSLSIAISVLVISCPCALGLATPVAIVVSTGKAASLGILIKSAESLEITGKAEVIAFDKTGTLTSGKLSVIAVHPVDNPEKLLHVAVSLEESSNHPISQAIKEYATEKSIPKAKVQQFMVHPGRGISAEIDGVPCFAGNRNFLRDNNVEVPDFSESENSLMYVAEGKRFLGTLEIADTLRDTSKETIETLQTMGLDTVMLTGDSDNVAKRIAHSLKIRNYYANLLPIDKERIVQKIQSENRRVIMVGDGINDAPALIRADVGIAVESGCDVAIDSGDIVLMNNNPLTISMAVELSRSTIRIIKENLFWAVIYNAICIPLAAGVLYPAFGILLPPGIAALAMSCSSVCVVCNALRLRRFKSEKLPLREITNTENPISLSMKKTIHIEGMMCKHCQAAVSNALKTIDGVSSVEVSLEKKIAVVTLANDVDDAVLSNAVVAADFEVTGIENN